MTNRQRFGRPAVLLIEPDDRVAREVHGMLASNEEGRFEVERAKQLDEGTDRLSSGAFAAVLLDPPEGDLESARDLVQSFPSLAVVVLARVGNPQQAIAALRVGAQDCVSRDEIDAASLQRSLKFAIERSRFRLAESNGSQGASDREGSEERLRLLESAVEQASDAILICTAEAHHPESHKVVYVNPAFTRMSGYSPGDLVAQSPFQLGGPETTEEEAEQLYEELASGRTLSGEMVAYDKDRRKFIMQWQVVPLLGEDRGVTHLVAVHRDISEHRRLEEQLRQSQKMEAVGRLAGGVSHDFNNLLTAIIGYNQLLLLSLGADHPQRDAVEQIGRAAKRAATLTSQLLAFSRQQVLQPKVIDLNQVVTGIEPILRRLIGEDIDLITSLSPEAASVKADPGQLEQVILNLAINARDAMPEGGYLAIETGDIDLGVEQARELDGEVGAYVRMRVRDSGQGMDNETQAKIFEPFFTTKGQEQGTGLGLATVYGIVKQSGGFIGVESAAESGTIFDVFLPRVADQPLQPIRRRPVRALEKGEECVLLAEDEDIVRLLVTEVLTENGYQVLAAADGGEALSIAADETVPIDLLISDVVMPDMRGPQLGRQIGAERPDVRMLFISGYADGAIPDGEGFGSEVPFLQKPFSPEALLHKVREVLDQAEGDANRESRPASGVEVDRS